MSHPESLQPTPYQPPPHQPPPYQDLGGGVVSLAPRQAPLLLTAAAAPAPRPRPPQRLRALKSLGPQLGQILLDHGQVQPGDLLKAMVLRERQEIDLGTILLAHGWVREADLTAAQCLAHGCEAADFQACPPDPRLIDRLGASECLALACLPWRRAGGVTVIATARPEAFAQVLARLTQAFGPCAMALASERQIHAALLAQRQSGLARRAETRLAAEHSCRGLDARQLQRLWRAPGLVLGLAFGLGLWLAPMLALQGLMLGLLALALGAMLAMQGLKMAALWASCRRPAPPPPLPSAPSAGVRPLRAGRLPVVSIMVPMYREKNIAPRLLARLGRLEYPRELLDVLLVVEEIDLTTRAALAAADLPGWMRIITVPDGAIRTKPRALNFALNFCRGTLIGVYDAEDAPEPDQIHKMVRQFAESPADVVCLQGVLDFYNPRSNLIARCFTLEYAAWFRLLLPGIARLGLAVPLGGTTLFFRRAPLEALGGWDAHNVTEDADLGLRLARAGFRTAMLDSTTYEEANCRPLAWVRQRSRWQKGFAMTWAVHMRDPARLWRDLGPRGFWGMQLLILGSLGQALLAPLIWSFWPMLFGLAHPLAPLLAGGWGLGFLALLLLSEVVTMLCALVAIGRSRHLGLGLFVPFLHLYNMLATFSAWKAAYELTHCPFFWDKTEHGLFDAAQGAG